jgi:hypothetical protein
MSIILQKHSRGILKHAKGDCPDLIHSDQMALRTVKWEAGLRERWPKAFKTKLAQATIRLESIEIRVFS